MATERAKWKAAQARQALVERAQAEAARLRQVRAAVLAQLPDVRNPRSRIRVGEQTPRSLPERKTLEGQRRQVRAFRQRAAAEKLQNVGRARKAQLVNELQYGPQADRLLSTMNRDQQQRFQAYSERIARGSQQSVAILFDHAGGQGQYSAALERILASPESRDVEEGLAMLEALAEQAEKAAVMYAPSRIGRLSV